MGEIARAEENQEFLVKRDASICLGLIHLCTLSIGDPHSGDYFASGVHFHSTCFIRRSKPIIVSLGVYSTCFPRVPKLDNMILLRVVKGHQCIKRRGHLILGNLSNLTSWLGPWEFTGPVNFIKFQTIVFLS